MRTAAAIFLAAAAAALPATASAGPLDTCQAEPCTDPVGHFTKPAKPVLDAIGVDPKRPLG